MKLITMLWCCLILSCGLSPAQTPVLPPQHGADVLLAVNDTVTGGPDAPPPDFVEVEKEPVVKSTKVAVYPDLALRAGLEGKVWLKLWIDTKGEVRNAIVLKSDNEIFNQSAIEAARQFTFAPAYAKGKPVSVWVSLPFKFKLGGEASEIAKNFRDLRPTLTQPTVLIIAGPKGLKDHISYPSQSIKARVEGAVYVQVGLTDKKRLLEIKITKSLNEHCDMAVLSGIVGYDFAADKDLLVVKGGDTIPVVVQFILPAK